MDKGSSDCGWRAATAFPRRPSGCTDPRTAHLAGPDTRILAMKGIYPADEIARIPAGFALEQSIELAVPGLDAERHLLIVKRT